MTSGLICDNRRVRRISQTLLQDDYPLCLGTKAQVAAIPDFPHKTPPIPVFLWRKTKWGNNETGDETTTQTDESLSRKQSQNPLFSYEN